MKAHISLTGKIVGLCIALFVVLPPVYAEVSGAIDLSSGYRATNSDEWTARFLNTVVAVGELGERFGYGVEISTSLSEDLLDVDGNMDGEMDAIPEPAIQLLSVDNAYIYGPFFGSGNIDPESLRVTIGRFPFSDVSGAVVSTPADGFSLSMDYPRVGYTVSLGYTGLLWRDSSSVLMSNTDLNASGQDDTLFGSPRLIGILGIRLPQFFNQQVIVNALFQEDMWSSENADFIPEQLQEFRPGLGGALDTQYLGLAVSGPVMGNLFQSSFGFFNSGRMLSFEDVDDPNLDGIYRYRPITGWVFGTSVRYYRPDWNFTALGLRVVVSSGDDDFTSYYEGNTDGAARQFIPITPMPFGAVFSPKLGNVAVSEIHYSLKPLSASSSWVLASLQTQVRGLVFFRTTRGPISEAGIAVGEGGNLLGSEIDFSAVLTPLADLTVSLNGGLFFPAGVDGMGAFTEEYLSERKVHTSLSVQASLAY